MARGVGSGVREWQARGGAEELVGDGRGGMVAGGGVRTGEEERGAGGYLTGEEDDQCGARPSKEEMARGNWVGADRAKKRGPGWLGRLGQRKRREIN